MKNIWLNLEVREKKKQWVRKNRRKSLSENCGEKYPDIKIDVSGCKNEVNTNEYRMDGVMMNTDGEGWNILKFFRHKNPDKVFASWLS